MTAVEELNETHRVEARYDLQPEHCFKCGVVGELYRHGTLEQGVNDTPHSGKPVLIALTRQRYRCRACGGTFLQPVEDIDEHRLATRRLVQYVERQVLRRTFVSVASEVGISEGTARNIFRDFAARLEAQHVFQAPELLGIDELHLRGQARCIMTNLKAHQVVDFLETRSKLAVYNALRRLVGRDHVEVVAMDMYRPYKSAVRAALPHAVVVVDKFHVVKLATQALDGFRRLLGKGLSVRQRRHVMRRRGLLIKRPWNLTDEERLQVAEWTAQLPELGVAYELKERFFGMYDATTVSDAKQLLDAWRAAVTPEMETVFREVLSATKNWEPEILNYFATGGVTNAYTEAANNQIRVQDRAGRGYSFEVIRVKALFAHGQHTPRAARKTLNIMRIEKNLARRMADVRVYAGVPYSTFVEELTDHDGAS